MDKNRIQGKVKDVAGRIERQTGEWTGDKKKQVRGAAKQAEGKVQNAWGKAKDAVRDAGRQTATPTEEEEESTASRHD
jgi:uncharacterized protein YjbJ (UPF0337 family)